MKKKEKLNILYEDKYLIVIEKPSGLLTIGTIKERENSKFSLEFSFFLPFYISERRGKALGERRIELDGGKQSLSRENKGNN